MVKLVFGAILYGIWHHNANISIISTEYNYRLVHVGVLNRALEGLLDFQIGRSYWERSFFMSYVALIF